MLGGAWRLLTVDRKMRPPHIPPINIIQFVFTLRASLFFVLWVVVATTGLSTPGFFLRPPLPRTPTLDIPIRAFHAACQYIPMQLLL